MKSALDRLTTRVLLLALPLWCLTGTTCASKSNPVLSSTGGSTPTGLVGTAVLDSGAGDVLPASDPRDVVSDLASDLAQSAPCNLLVLNDCANKGLKNAGCYPVLGASVCLTAGGLYNLTNCVPEQSALSQSSADQRCLPGLVCVPNAQLGQICAQLCAMGVTSDPKLTCVGSTCLALQSLPGSGAGYCNPF
jgi:hypothetical protein